MITSRLYPKVSSYHVLEGAHYFNQILFPPPGVRAAILKPPEKDLLWDLVPSMRGISAHHIITADADNFMSRPLEVYEPLGKTTYILLTVILQHRILWKIQSAWH